MPNDHKESEHNYKETEMYSFNSHVSPVQSVFDSERLIYAVWTYFLLLHSISVYLFFQVNPWLLQSVDGVW